MICGRSEEGSSVQEDLVTNPEYGCEVTPSSVFFFISPLRSSQVCVGFLAEVRSLFDDCHYGVHG